jgi:hypothetical protein
MQAMAGIVLPRIGYIGKAGEKLFHRVASGLNPTLGIQLPPAPQPAFSAAKSICDSPGAGAAVRPGLLIVSRGRNSCTFTGLRLLGDRDERGCRLITGLFALNSDLGVPTPQTFGISRDAWFGRIEIMAGQAIASGSPANNRRIADRLEIAALYQAIWA